LTVKTGAAGVDVAGSWVDDIAPAAAKGENEDPAAEEEEVVEDTAPKHAAAAAVVVAGNVVGKGVSLPLSLHARTAPTHTTAHSHAGAECKPDGRRQSQRVQDDWHLLPSSQPTSHRPYLP
jgi:hypothetical protein